MITSRYIWWFYKLTQSPEADEIISTPMAALVILVILLAGVTVAESVYSTVVWACAQAMCLCVSVCVCVFEDATIPFNDRVQPVVKAAWSVSNADPMRGSRVTLSP